MGFFLSLILCCLRSCFLLLSCFLFISCFSPACCFLLDFHLYLSLSLYLALSHPLPLFRLFSSLPLTVASPSPALYFSPLFLETPSFSRTVLGILLLVKEINNPINKAGSCYDKFQARATFYELKHPSRKNRTKQKPQKERKRFPGSLSAAGMRDGAQGAPRPQRGHFSRRGDFAGSALGAHPRQTLGTSGSTARQGAAVLSPSLLLLSSLFKLWRKSRGVAPALCGG